MYRGDGQCGRTAGHHLVLPPGLHRTPSRRLPSDGVAKKIVVEKIAKHLEECGCLISKKMPPPHRTPSAAGRVGCPNRGLPRSAGERPSGRAHVLDDDTIVADGIHVRLKGMAKPQVAHHQDPGKPVGEAAKAFMVDLIEGQVVVCDLAQDRTHGRRVGWCYRNGRDVAAELIGAGLARDCPRYSGGRCQRGAAGGQDDAVPDLLSPAVRRAVREVRSRRRPRGRRTAPAERAPAVSRGHGAHVGATVGRRDAEDLVPGDRATDVEHDDALATVGKAAHGGRPAVLPVAAGHAVLVAGGPSTSREPRPRPGRGTRARRGRRCVAHGPWRQCSIWKGRAYPRRVRLGALGELDLAKVRGLVP